MRPANKIILQSLPETLQRDVHRRGNLFHLVGRSCIVLAESGGVLVRFMAGIVLAGLVLLAGLTLSPSRCGAVPALPATDILKQPDGFSFEAKQWGDERSNGYETADDYTIVLVASTGCWVYAERGPSGGLTPSRALPK
jgi:hypothetical protein